MSKKPTAKPTKKKSRPHVNWRTHCKVDTLPIKLQIAIGQMILDKEWPGDFKAHYNGTPRYVDIVQYCREKGYAVSNSAIGRFALRIQKRPHIKTMSTKMQDYVLNHLAEICSTFVDLQNELLDSQVHPTSSWPTAIANELPMTPARRARLEELREQKLLYIEKVIKDLHLTK